jgi:hypothetical protein
MYWLREIPGRIYVVHCANVLIAIVVCITGRGVGIFCSYLRRNVRTRISVSRIFGSSFGAPARHRGTEQDCGCEEVLGFRPGQRHHRLLFANSGVMILLGFIWRVNGSRVGYVIHAPGISNLFEVHQPGKAQENCVTVSILRPESGRRLIRSPRRHAPAASAVR